MAAPWYSPLRSPSSSRRSHGPLWPTKKGAIFAGHMGIVLSPTYGSVLGPAGGKPGAGYADEDIH
jgi:hypothetical protein